MTTINSNTRGWWWLAAAVGFGALVWLLAPMLTPFVLSGLLAWLGNPLVGRLERAGRTRTTAVVLVYVLMVLLLVLALLVLIPLLSNQVERFIAWLPRLADWLTGTAVPWLGAKLHVDVAAYVDPTTLIDLLKSHWQQAGGVAATVIGGLSKSGLAVIEALISLLLVPVLTFYFLRDWAPMLRQVRELLPRPLEPTVVQLAGDADAVLGSFLRGQLSVMLALGAIYATGLTLVGLDLGLLIGVVAGLVSFVPYLGAAVGVGAAIIATLVQHGDLVHLGLVLAVFAIGHLCENFVLTPWLVGDRIGLHPVAVIFSIMAGGELFGFLGVLLALPVAAVAMVGLRYAHRRYTESALYGADHPVVAPDAAPLAGAPVVATPTAGASGTDAPTASS